MNLQRIFIVCALFYTTSLSQTDEIQQSWNLSAGIKYLNKYSNYGLDLSNDRAGFSYELGLAHENGLSAHIAAVQVQDAGIQQWSLGLDYEREMSDWLELAIGYTYFHYSNDSVNVLAELSHELSVSADISIGDFELGFSYDKYPGTNPATYYGISLSGYYKVHDFTFIPLVQTTYMSQEIEGKFLQVGKKKKISSSETSVSTVTGMSSFSIHLIALYPILQQLTLTLHPSYVYTPQEDISAYQSQFIWSVGLRYSISF